jgi:hypothetical protein
MTKRTYIVAFFMFALLAGAIFCFLSTYSSEMQPIPMTYPVSQTASNNKYSPKVPESERNVEDYDGQQEFDSSEIVICGKLIKKDDLRGIPFCTLRVYEPGDSSSIITTQNSDSTGKYSFMIPKDAYSEILIHISHPGLEALFQKVPIGDSPKIVKDLYLNPIWKGRVDWKKAYGIVSGYDPTSFRGKIRIFEGSPQYKNYKLTHYLFGDVPTFESFAYHDGFFEGLVRCKGRICFEFRLEPIGMNIPTRVFKGWRDVGTEDVRLSFDASDLGVHSLYVHIIGLPDKENYLELALVSLGNGIGEERTYQEYTSVKVEKELKIDGLMNGKFTLELTCYDLDNIRNGGKNDIDFPSYRRTIEMNGDRHVDIDLKGTTGTLKINNSVLGNEVFLVLESWSQPSLPEDLRRSIMESLMDNHTFNLSGMETSVQYIPSGKYVFSVHSEGYQEGNLTFEIRPGETKEVAIVLSKQD